MATYQHSSTYDDGSYLKYNQVPAAGSYIGPGKTITVSGMVKNTANADKCIVLALAGRLTYYVMAYKNMTIKKNTQTAFSVSFVMTADQWQQLKYFTNNNICTIDFGLLLCPSAKTTEILGKNLDNYNLNEDIFEQPTDGNSTWNMYGSANAGPTVTAPTLTDEAAVSALSAFGGMATGHSLPRVSASWAYDSHYPDQLGHVALTLTGAMTGTYEKDMASGVTAAAFDLPTPAQAGTVNWTLTVTDMFGSVSTATGSFAVLSYVKPYITSCSFERYRTVQTDTGWESEPSPSGEYIWLNLDANIAAVNSRNAWTATLTAWRKERPEIAPTAGSAVYENTTGERRTVSTWALAGSDGRHIELTRDEGNLSNQMVLSAAYDWSLRLTLADALGNSVTLLVDDDIRKDSAILDVGPYGVSVGARSTALEADPQFECSYPARFYGDVAVSAGGLLKVVTVTTNTASISGTSAGTLTAQVDPGDGWTALGIVGYNLSRGVGFVYRAVVSGSGAIDFRIYNTTSSSVQIYGTVYVLCVRTSL